MNPNESTIPTGTYSTDNPPQIESKALQALLADDVDVPVDTSEPRFTGISPRAILADIVPVEGKDDNKDELVLLVQWALDEPAIDTGGREHPSGTRLTQRIFVKAGATSKSPAQQLDIGNRAKADIISACENLPKGTIPTSNGRLIACKGKAVQLGLRAKKDKKDPTRTNQNFFPAALANGQ